MQDLADRIATLEKSNRNLRVSCAASLILCGLAFLLGADTKSPSKSDVIRTEKLVVGSAGKASATLEAEKDGFGLMIRDSRNRVVSAWTYMDALGSHLTVGTPTGKGQISLLTSNGKVEGIEKGESRLTIQGSDAKGEVRLFAIPGGFNALTIIDGAAEPRVRIATHGTKVINVIE